MGTVLVGDCACACAHTIGRLPTVCGKATKMRVIAVFTATFLASTVLVTGALVETTNFYPTNGIVNLEVTLAVEVCNYVGLCLEEGRLFHITLKYCLLCHSPINLAY